MSRNQKIILLLLGIGNFIVCTAIALFYLTLSQPKTQEALQSTPVLTPSPSIIAPTKLTTPLAPTLVTTAILPTLPLPNISGPRAPLPTRDPLQGNVDVAVKAIDLVANDLIFDAAGKRIYASVPGRGGPKGNSLTAINVPAGTIGGSIFVGSEPTRLAISVDGHYVYVGLNGSGSVRRVNLATQSAESEFSLGSGFCGVLVAEDMAVVPGSSKSVVIAKRNSKCSPRHEGVSIYDEGVQRPSGTPGHTGSNSLTFSRSPSVLYGYNNETTEFGLRTMNISSSGISTSSTVPNLISGFGHQIHFENGLIYSTSGSVINPISMSLVGTFPVKGWMVPNSSAGRAYFLTLANFRDPFELRVYDLKTFVLLKTISLPELDGIPLSLIQVGPDLFASHTSADKVYLIQLQATRQALIKSLSEGFCFRLQIADC